MEQEPISNPEDASDETLAWLGTQGPLNGIGNRWNSAQERFDRARILRNAFYLLNADADESEDFDLI